jgi:hypothetical protein
VDQLELLLFLEEHAKADDSAVDKKTAGDGHNHSGDPDNLGVC